MISPRYQAVKKWLSSGWRVNATLPYSAFILLIVAVFGLRDIIITSAIIRILNSEGNYLFLQPIYWIFLLISILLFIIYFYNHQSNIRSLARTFVAHRTDILISILIAIPFFYLALTRRLFLDYWLDEIISIRRHISTSVSSALFWYPAPNNHIFSNVVSGIYLKLLGFSDLYLILKFPHILRFLYLAFGVGTVAIFSNTAYRFIGKWAGLFAVILFCTTIAYLNFIVQVRGYSPSIFFTCVIIFSILNYAQRMRFKDGMIILVFSAMLFYTIPSNSYYLLSLIIYFSISGLTQLVSNLKSREFSFSNKKFLFVNTYLSIAGFIGFGLLVSFLLYVPILSQVLENQYVNTAGLFQGTAIPDQLSSIFQDFISGRDWLFFIAFLGIILSLISAIKRNESNRLPIMLFSFSGFLFPFILSFIRGDVPFKRIFLITLPSFFLLTAFGLDYLINLLRKIKVLGKTLAVLIMIVIFVYANIIFYSSFQENSISVSNILVNEDINQIGLYDDRFTTSVFLDHYEVRSVIQSINQSPDQSLPLLIDMDNTRYSYTLIVYLDAYQIPYSMLEDNGIIPYYDANIILSYPKKSLENLKQHNPKTKCHQISNEISIYKMMRCSF